jgi:hypothetical protein
MNIGIVLMDLSPELPKSSFISTHFYANVVHMIRNIDSSTLFPQSRLAIAEVGRSQLSDLEIGLPFTTSLAISPLPRHVMAFCSIA